MDTLKQDTKTVYKFILERYDGENNILMTEAEMSERFKMSRNRIREIMATAKLIGAITSKQGSSYRLTNKKELQEFYDRYLKN